MIFSNETWWQKMIQVQNALLKKLSVKNYGILQDVSIEFSDACTLIIGKNKIGKSTLLEALKRMQYFALNTIPLGNFGFSKLLRFTKENKETDCVTIDAEFAITCDDHAFDGQYRYMLKLNLKGIQEEKLIVMGTNAILKLYQGENVASLLLVSRTFNSITYYHMILENEGYKIETDTETRHISRPDISSLNLLWDEGREPYITPVRQFLAIIGGYEPKIILQAFPKLLDQESCLFQNMDMVPNDDTLGILLQIIKQEDPEIISELENYIHLLYDDFRSLAIPDRKTADIVYMNENQSKGDISIPLDLISSGTRLLLFYILKGLLCKKNAPQILIIEDIEHSLHPGLIGKFLEISQDFNVQTILTTHSPFVLDYLKDCDVRVLARDDNNNVKVFNGYNKEMLGQSLGVPTDEANIINLWYHGDDDQMIAGTDHPD